jgi:hypothetical protein
MKTQAMVSVDATVWRMFRGACIQRGLTASRLFEDFMREQLKKWGVEGVEKEPKRKLRK